MPAMPEIAVTEHRDARIWEHHVWPPRETSWVNPISEAKFEQRPA
jgi:hypothetical protein